MLQLASARLFAGLARDEVNAVLAAAASRRYRTGETVIRADNPATHLFVVKTGCLDYHIVTESGRIVLLRRMVPGNAFGVAAFLSEPTGYLGTAIAVTNLEVLVWERRMVRRLLRSYPRLVENALRIALHYIALYAERHVRLVSDPAPERMAYALTSVAARTGYFLPSGVEVDIKNKDLASFADVSHFTASRLLKQWERKGTVAKSRGGVLIRCPERLLA
jgi:CRP-like cAMP-binding protein